MASRAASISATPLLNRSSSGIRSMVFLRGCGSSDEHPVQALEGCGWVVRGAAMEWRGLHQRAARRREPMEALRLGHGRKWPGQDLARGDALDETELIPDGLVIASGPKRIERRRVERRTRPEKPMRPAEDDEPGIEELLALDIGNDPDDRVGERATRRRHAGPRCGRVRPRPPTCDAHRDAP